MSLVTDVLQGVIGKMEVRTRFGPTITLDDPFSSSPSTQPGASQWLKPMIQLYPKSGGAPITIAPYGDPGDTLWPYIVAGGGLLLGWLTYRSFGR